MNIFNSYKRSRFFLWVNITGLAIGLAASIMLILFVVNELSYDRHFANKERIVRLINSLEMNGEKHIFPIALRKAYTEIPEKVSGIEAAVQILKGGTANLIYETNRFQGLNLIFADSSFFRVFQMKFVEGMPTKPFESTQSIVITRKYADIVFGNSSNAMGKSVTIDDRTWTVSGVVEALPTNTHFTFDVLANIGWHPEYQGLEYLTYYLINPDASLQTVSSSIEKGYTGILEPFTAQFNAKGSGIIEKLTDIHLHSKAEYGGKNTDMKFIWLLTILALLILALAVVNFVNLFMAQSETRMKETGIRKTNGAGVPDIIRQFFTEISGIVLVAFLFGLFLAILAAPYFSQLIQKDIDLRQLMNPAFMVCILLLFVITVTLSATYPSFYMSRFSPLDILNKRLKFSKQRLTAVLIILQSVITIVLISYILIINRQTAYLKDMPLNYNTQNVMVFETNRSIVKSYPSLRQELLTMPNIQKVSATHHLIGGGCSGQTIALLENRESSQLINEYRILPGICELMEFQLVDGEFFKEDAPDSVRSIVINQATLKLLDLQLPVAGKQVDYCGKPAEITGVVKDFIYESPVNPVQPLVLTTINTYPVEIYVKFDDNTDRIKARETVLNILQKFDPEFVLNPEWNEDIYAAKFDDFNTQFKLVLTGSLLSVFIAMIGLLAIHLYTTKRRTKEIGIRRINGAGAQTIFTMLSWDIIKWIIIAGVIAVPVAYYVASDWLNNYTNHARPDWTIFVIPILIQCLVALLTTSGVSLNVLSQNPVKSLKSE